MGGEGLEELVSRAIGLDPASLGAQGFRRAVARRRRAVGLEDRPPEEYDRLVRSSPAEFQELVEELVVPETWFFRDGQPFVALRRYAARWLGSRISTPLRVLSAPCSSGEEPYSIAMTLLDAGLLPGRFVIEALDISLRALERARRGVYGPASLRGLDPTVRERYFRPHARGVEVVPRVRGAVQFFPGNLLDPGTLRGRGPYEVVFCRNLLIYLGEPARARVVATIERLLVSGGLLFVGHAERIRRLSSQFTTMALPGTFAYCKGEGPCPPAEVRPARLAARPAPASGRGGTRGAELATGAFGRTPHPNSPPQGGGGPERSPPTLTPSPKGGGDQKPGEGDARSAAPVSPADLLAEAAARANGHEYEAAVALCERDIRQRGPSAGAFHLLGAIAQAQGDWRAAERWFHKAIYLDARHAEALLALALLAERRGDWAAAARYRRRADRAHREGASR